MTHDRTLFTDLKPTAITKVRIGNGDHIPVKGKGTIAIPTNSGTKSISDVLLVPDIDQNLLSVGQLIEKEFKVFFEDYYCSIKDATGQDLFKVKMRGKSFSLDPVQGRIRSDFSGTSIQRVLENDVTVSEKDKVRAKRIILNGGNLKVKVISSIKGPLGFQDDDQPCCCSRKERTSQGVALNYQESQLLRRRTMASVMLPVIGKQPGNNMNTRPNNLNMSPEMISISNCPSSRSEKVIFPVMKASTDSIPINGSTDAALKIPSHSDCDSASPSACNPILRLMEKKFNDNQQR